MPRLKLTNPPSANSLSATELITETFFNQQDGKVDPHFQI